MQFGDGTLDQLLAPDTILPEQYFGQLAGRNLSCEHALVLAVLEDAIRDWQFGQGPASPRRIKHALEAHRWLFDDDAAHPSAFSFAGVCEALGIDPEYLRQGLIAWRERGGDRIKNRAPIGHTNSQPIRPRTSRGKRRAA